VDLPALCSAAASLGYHRHMTTPLLSESPAALGALSGVGTLYTDLDGTLLGFGGSLLIDGKGDPSAATAEAIARINSAGLTVVIATGRNRLQCAEIARLCGWRGFIAELGCVIVPDRGADPLYLTGEWPDDALEPGETPFAAIERLGAPTALAEAFPGRLEPHAPYHLNREATHMLRGSLDLAAARAVLGELELPVGIVDNGIIHPLSTGLSADITEIHAYHLMPAGVTKAAAVAVDLDRRGVAREQAGAIGDSASDVGIADEVALGVVVANGLADRFVRDAAEARENVYATAGKRGSGWVEFADAWLMARPGRRDA
jgi:predicted mannosyl-3-phosphoglycerate phosphatase (HAD superfamily)